jgi:hypothetical protein
LGSKCFARHKRKGKEGNANGWQQGHGYKKRSWTNPSNEKQDPVLNNPGTYVKSPKN